MTLALGILLILYALFSDGGKGFFWVLIIFLLIGIFC